MRGRQRTLTIILGLVIAAIVTAFISLGLWQLDRLQERRDFNATLTARSELPVIDIEQLIGDPESPPEEAAYRRVSATGTYVSQDEVVIAGRSRNTLAGHHVVTPIEVSSGTGLLVNRGWVGLEDSDPPIARAAAPSGEVTVTGVLFPSQQRGRFGPKHVSDGRLEVLHRIDIPRIEQQASLPLYPFYLLIETQDPPQEGAYPQSISIPGLDEGPHLSYALQWFAFAAIGLAMYGAYVYAGVRKARRAATPAT